MLLFLYGPDTYRAREKLKEIIGKYETDIKKGAVELKKFDGEDLEFSDLKNALEMAALFSSKKIILVKNAAGGGNAALKEKMLEYLPLMAKSGDLIIFWDGEADKRDKFFKALKKEAKVQEFGFLQPIEIKKWIEEKIKSRILEMKVNISLSSQAKEALANFVGPNLWQMESEIDKLILYKTGTGSKEKAVIEMSDVELLVKSQIKTYIFKTIDAVSSKNKKEALRLLHEHLSNKENEFYIFTMIIWQMRNLIQIKDLTNKGLPAPQITKKTKISPFVIGKNFLTLKKITLSEIESIYDYLLVLDLAMKTGKIDSKLALDMFVLKFSF